MVQEIAKKLIRMGKKEEAQDLYFIPRNEGGRREALCAVLPF